MFKLLDAQAAMGFVVSQTAYIEPQVNAQVYPDVQYSFLVPVDSSAPEWIKTITFYSSDQFGRAQWINGNADDIPIAGTELTKYESSVYMAGIGYGYGLEEISQAQLLGYNLSANDALAARRAYEEFTDNVILRGSTVKNLPGFINNAAVTPQAATNGDWFGSGTTQTMIMQDINDAISSVFLDTKTTSQADTIALPIAHYNLAASTRLEFSEKTLLNWFRENNVYTIQTGRPLTFVGIRGLEVAGVGNVPRMIAYRRSPDVLKAHIPMKHRFLEPFRAGPIRWEVPGIFRLGGTDIRRPLEVRFVDGI